MPDEEWERERGDRERDRDRGERGSSSNQPAYYQSSRDPITLDRQTITVGAVFALLTFLIGICSGGVAMAFTLGAKSSSLDTLTVEVQGMRKDVNDLTTKYHDNEVKSSNRITTLEDKVNSIQSEVTEIRVQLQSHGLRR